MRSLLVAAAAAVMIAVARAEDDGVLALDATTFPTHVGKGVQVPAFVE